MRRILTALAVCAALIVAVAPNAHAKEMNGKIGIGGEAPIAGGGLSGLGGSSGPGLSLADNAGLSVVAGLAAFNVQVILGFERESAGGDVDNSTTGWFLIPRILFPFITDGDVVIHIVGGLGIGRTSTSIGDMSVSRTDIVLEGGIRPEWFVTDFISLHAQVGLGIVLVGDTGDAEDTGLTIITFLSNASLAGSAGFTFYF